MTGTQTILWSIDGDIAQLTLNRPEASNALDGQMIHELRDAALEIAAANPRAVLLSAKGRQFCVGGDLRSFEALGKEIGPKLRELTLVYHEAVSALTAMDAPLVAAVQGPAAGAGLSLICMCDFAIASTKALFSAAYTRVGLTPDGGLSYHLPRMIGLRRALDLVLTNRFFSAEEAMVLGIVNEVVSEDKLEQHSREMATRLAAGATAAMGAAKRLLRSSMESSLAEQLERESLGFSAAAPCAEAAEGRAAFLEKRAPVYSRPH